MKISGFTMVRNADKYYFPIRESILSVLPIVDEFVVAMGDNVSDDWTRERIESIGSDKVKVIDRVWSEEEFVDGKIFASETSFALSQCSGDWCFYLQADEVIHEQDLSEIQKACENHLDDKKVDGFLFQYYHFFGDYQHHLPMHGYYKNEIRIVRNNIGVYSYKDAQSFRKTDNQKLRVVPLAAQVYHYGFVRPPRIMQSKKKEQDSMHHGISRTEETYKNRANDFDFGALGLVPRFEQTHPVVMAAFIKKIDWQEQLNQSTTTNKLNRPAMKHERWKYRFLSFLENRFNGGKTILGYQNWIIVDDASK